MGNTNPWVMPVKGSRVDWKVIKDTIDLTATVTRHLGPPLRRRGRRHYWCCPFHDDRNPSFVVDSTRRRWNCYPCGIGGDAAAFAMKLGNMTFTEAIAYLAGGPTPSGSPTPPPRATSRPPMDAPADAKRMTEADALSLVSMAANRLWTPEGADALSYLHGRGLNDATIRAARLGFVPPLDLPGRPRGVVIAWFHGDRLSLIKIRQPEGRKPKYYEAYRDRPTIYPGPFVVRPGRPLVIVEGELDALLLGQVLADLAPVATLGSASARPCPAILGSMLSAFPWFVATDNDPAGDRAAGDWPAVARRVRPPGDFKDWTETAVGGVNLHRWWSDRLGGIEVPRLFTWEESALWRWGPALGDPTPGIVIDARPNRA